MHRKASGAGTVYPSGAHEFSPCPMQSVPITTIKRCEFLPCSGEVNSIQHYVIKFVSDLRQVGSFLQVFRFPPPIKLTATI